MFEMVSGYLNNRNNVEKLDQHMKDQAIDKLLTLFIQLVNLSNIGSQQSLHVSRIHWYFTRVETSGLILLSSTHDAFKVLYFKGDPSPVFNDGKTIPCDMFWRLQVNKWLLKNSFV